MWLMKMKNKRKYFGIFPVISMKNYGGNRSFNKHYPRKRTIVMCGTINIKDYIGVIMLF